MKASELRLGNYVIEEKGQIGQITGIDDTSRVSTNVGFFPYTPFDKIKPIPLTKEWLIKFGFEIDKNLTFYKMVARKGHFTLPLGKDNKWMYWSGYLCIKIPYVHNLQNLHWVLTETELTIK